MLSASSIDLAALAADEAEAALRAVSEHRARVGRSALWHQLLDRGTDAEIIAAAEAECVRNTPITLANRYSSGGINSGQELVYNIVGNHPRRPVIMRGALYTCIANYARWQGSLSATGWAGELLDRAIRSSRATILTNEEYREFLDGLRDRIRQKFGRVHSAFDRYVPSYIGRNRWDAVESETVLIAGRFKHLKASEATNLRALHAIVRKTERLDERIRLARQHMWQRLAA